MGNKIYRHPTTRTPATPTANLPTRFNESDRHHAMTIVTIQSFRPKTVKINGTG